MYNVPYAVSHIENIDIPTCGQTLEGSIRDPGKVAHIDVSQVSTVLANVLEGHICNSAVSWEIS